MRLSPLDEWIVAGYLIAIMAIGFAMKSKAAQGISSYFLGGRELPWWALAMSGSSSYFDITGTMWIVSTFVVLGLKGMWVHLLWGFPITAFYLAYMGRWIRRSGVTTGAEWMYTRFGSGSAGNLARLSYTIFAVLTIVALLGYGAIGMGKFGAVFLPFSPPVCATLILSITGLYVVVGGLHGIVRVEIIQTVVLSAGAILLAALGYQRFDAALYTRVPTGWESIVPEWRPAALHGVISGGTDYSLFGALVCVWAAKGFLLCLSGPEQLYDFQRFLAARNAREASLIGALWGLIHTVRWPFAMGVAVLAVLGTGVSAIDVRLHQDPETALPLIVAAKLPVGFAGFLLAALLSGFLATFSSTVNGGASYLIKDLYQRYLRPQASERALIRASYVASALLIAAGIAVSYLGQSINTAFLWIFGTLAAGILPPNVLRWYWWRLNGQGYAAGIFTGMALSFAAAFVDTFVLHRSTPLYISFPTIAVASLVATVITTLRTPPTDTATLCRMYDRVQPWGWWGPVARKCACDTAARSEISSARDIGNAAAAATAFTALYVGSLYWIIHEHGRAGVCFGTALAAAFVLYFTWYLHLPPRAQQSLEFPAIGGVTK